MAIDQVILHKHYYHFVEKKARTEARAQIQQTTPDNALPPNLSDLLDEDRLVRIVDSVVDSIDILISLRSLSWRRYKRL